mgnify:CR=1 FL=1|tara:strand:+ start:9901 stop:10206 length:306 start_codon:yes stop_codon:yes gene_type:complete
MENLFKDVEKIIDKSYETSIFSVCGLIRRFWRTNYNTEDLKVAYKYFDETVQDIDKSMYTLGVNSSVTNNNTVYLHLVNIREFYVELAKGIREELKRRDNL